MTATAVAPPPAPASMDDPWESADKATWDPSFSTFGQVQAETFYCVLQKGVGKVAFDPNQHEIGDRKVGVKITIIPAIAGRSNTERELIAESAEWVKIVNPSIKALGPQWNLKALHNQWVEAKLVSSGRKYMSKPTDGSPPVERDATTIAFVRVFATEDECVAAAQAGRGYAGGGATASATAAPAVAAAPNDAEKKTATAFLGPLWRSAGGDISKFEELLAKNALTAKYFDLNSPEVLAVVAPQTTGQLPF